MIYERLNSTKLTRGALAIALGGSAAFGVAGSQAVRAEKPQAQSVPAEHWDAASTAPTIDLRDEARLLRAQIVKAKQEEAARNAARLARVIPTPYAGPQPSQSPSPTSLPTPSPQPKPTSTQSPLEKPAIAGSDATNAFTPDWYRCVIIPESSNRAHITSGLFGILTTTWHDYEMKGVPGDYSPDVQAKIALEIYDANGGFGPGAWNNTAHCGKDG